MDTAIMETIEMPTNTQKPAQTGSKPSSSSTTKQSGGASKPISAKPASTGRK